MSEAFSLIEALSRLSDKVAVGFKVVFTSFYFATVYFIRRFLIKPFFFIKIFVYIFFDLQKISVRHGIEVVVMSGNDYLKFMTEQVVSYIDLPSEERKKRKEAQRKQNSFYTTRWFGMLPFTLKIMFQKENSR